MRGATGANATLPEPRAMDPEAGRLGSCPQGAPILIEGPELDSGVTP